MLTAAFILAVLALAMGVFDLLNPQGARFGTVTVVILAVAVVLGFWAGKP